MDARNDSLQIRQAGGCAEHPATSLWPAWIIALSSILVMQPCSARLRRAGLGSLDSPCFQRRRNGGQASESTGRDHRSLEGNQNNFWVFTSVFRRAAIKVNLRVTSSVLGSLETNSPAPPPRTLRTADRERKAFLPPSSFSLAKHRPQPSSPARRPSDSDADWTDRVAGVRASGVVPCRGWRDSLVVHAFPLPQ